MQKIAQLLLMGLKHAKPSANDEGKVSRAKADIDPKIREQICGEVDAMLADYPLYPELSLAGTTTPITA